MANVLPTFAEHLLPSNSTPLERVFAATVNERMANVPMLLKLLNDPYTVPVAFLNHLAFEVGVDIWNEDWDELKKRSVIAATIRTKRILGTREGIKTYIGLEGGKLLDVAVAPQTPFVSKALDGTADYVAYLGRLPQLRVYFGNEKRKATPDQFFIGKNAFVGSARPTPDKGREMLGRHAFLYDPITDTETRITLEDLGVKDKTRSERVKIPGKKGALEAFVGVSFVGQSVVTNDSAEPPRTVSYTLPANQSLDVGSLVLSLGSTFNPVSTRYDRVAVYGKADPTQAFVGHSFIGRGFTSSSDAVIDFYDRLYLADPSVPAPVTKGTSYVGHARLQMAPYRAEMLIDAQEKAEPGTAFEGLGFVGNCFVKKQDDTKRNRILRAIELSKAGRDRVFVDFQTTQVLTFGDAPAMDGSVTLGQRLPRNKL